MFTCDLIAAVQATSVDDLMAELARMHEARQEFLARTEAGMALVESLIKIKGGTPAVTVPQSVMEVIAKGRVQPVPPDVTTVPEASPGSVAATHALRKTAAPAKNTAKTVPEVDGEVVMHTQEPPRLPERLRAMPETPLPVTLVTALDVIGPCSVGKLASEVRRPHEEVLQAVSNDRQFVFDSRGFVNLRSKTGSEQ